MLGLMRVNYYYSLAAGWQNEQAAGTQIIATLADSTPLVVEKRLGDGKVVMQTTRVAPARGTLGSWSNFGPNPAFVVLTNELFGYLAYGAGADTVIEVGKSQRMPLDRTVYSGTGSIERVGQGTPFQATLAADATAEDLRLVSEPIDRAGLYELRLDRLGGGIDRRFAAVNPARGEGDLSLVADSTLRQKFAGEGFALRYADELSVEANPGESTLTEILLASLVLALVAEQALAYVCSFHE